MADNSSLLQPGETFGPVVQPVSQSPASADPSSLLQPGETLGAPVTASTDTSAQQPAQASVLDRSIQGAKDFAAPIAALVKPPETPTETFISTIGGGPQALTAYRFAKNVIASVDSAVKSTPATYHQAAQNVVKAVQDFHDKDYRNAISDAVSAGTVLAPTVVPGGAGTRELAEGIRPGGDLARPLTRQALTAGTMLAGGEVLGPEEEAANTAASRLKVNPFRRPGFVKQVLQGESVAQPAATSAMTDAAAAAAKDSGVAVTPTTGGFRTALDDTLSKTAKIERAQYDQINQAAGVDLKNLYERAGELEDALDDPTNIVQKPALQVELERTRMQIANGESKAAESGIDAKKAVRNAKDLTQQRFALADLKAKIFNNESVVEGDEAVGKPEKINVDNAIKAVQRMDKPSRYAPEGTPSRLRQALGDDGAKTFKQSLYDAQKLGESAISKQRLLKNVLKYGGITGGVVTGAYGGIELLKHVLGGD